MAEIDEWDILSIEAGGTPTLNSEVPMLFSTMSRTNQDWIFKSDVNGACKATKDQKCYIPRGKVVGGCSAVNLMIYMRGSRIPYDNWRDVYNCTGWGFDDLLPYFKKSEGNTMNWNNSKYHSQCGPLRVSSFDQSDPYIDFFAKAGREMNPSIPTVRDYNGGVTGQSYVITQSTTFNGRRWSASKAYIIPIKYKKKLSFNPKCNCHQNIIQRNTSDWC